MADGLWAVEALAPGAFSIDGWGPGSMRQGLNFEAEGPDGPENSGFSLRIQGSGCLSTGC